MPSLARTLGITTPTSVLVRKARRLGIGGPDDAIALAVRRGCRHYSPLVKVKPPEVSRQDLPDDELTILMICGEQDYEPMSIRCAAQLARSPLNDARRMAHLAIREKADKTLAHIARAGFEHDVSGRTFWQSLLIALPPHSETSDPALPHWTRFVSLAGQHRGKQLPAVWLTPAG